ncbi:hypothetical protein AXE77_06375 [Gardnerella vaginalis]|uniref:Uncharacterized protein n=1 Tax=Gardnerella vaginalis TaxID=2702 RepID=A0A3E1J0N3_GARVA|nr:hypothetical protein AXE77_06375 [Gardnerella vaginalis]
MLCGARALSASAGRRANAGEKNSGKCSIITQIQQQMPEKILPQMFQKTTKTATNAGNFPGNVPKNGQNSNKCRKFSRKCSTKRPIRSRERLIYARS